MTAPWPPERTFMQERRPYDPRYDVRTDAVAVYNVDATFPARLAAWKAHGYQTFAMIGVAWGEYQDYVLGQWDGMVHWDDAQYLVHPVRRTVEPKLHAKDIPYMVPTPAYRAYLQERLEQAIDAGVAAVMLEEPEFWSATNYGPAFERAWAAAYGEPWRDPAGDPLAWSMAARLKHRLYVDLIADLSAAVKRYSAAHGGAVRCYVATHSPLNYAAWSIVSPGLGLRGIPDLDGVVVQTWSFTARSRTAYAGGQRDRLAAVAFLEYGSGLELVRGLDRHVWLLADPVEDRPTQPWDAYRTGYHATVAASLCWPEAGAYEVMPWPGRVFTWLRPQLPDGAGGQPIPQGYASEILAVANALRSMPHAEVEWDCGTRGIGVLISDTMLWRRNGPGQDDADLSTFYGLALPPLLAGMPVRPVGMEALATSGVPDDVCLLLLSYDGMIPPDAESHAALASWVHAGGALLCFGSGAATYTHLPGWWDRYDSGQPGVPGPWPDLLRRLRVDPLGHDGLHRVGPGVVVLEPLGPRALAMQAGGAARVRGLIRLALEALGPAAPPYSEQSYLLVRRGPFVIALAPAGTEDGGAPAPLRLNGQFIDLFDGTLPVRSAIDCEPGGCLFLLDLQRVCGAMGTTAGDAAAAALARVLAAAGRVDDEHVASGVLSCTITGPSGTEAVLRVRLPAAPLHALVGGQAAQIEWHAPSGTALLRCANDPAGVHVVVHWA